MFYDDPYLEFVHKTALENGQYFLLDSGEGRGFEDNNKGWHVEDLSGWLIAPADHMRFIKARKSGTVDEDFKDQYVFAKWIKLDNGNIEIEFKKY